MDALSLIEAHIPALPEVLLLLGACVVMIADLFVRDERRTASFAMAQVVLLLCVLATFAIQLASGTDRYSLFNGLFVSDVMSNLLKLAAYVSVSVTLVYSRQYLIDRGLMRGEFLSLLLFALLG